MIRRLLLVGGLIVFAAPTRAGQLLANPSFDEKPGFFGGVPGWSSQGDRFGKATLVTNGVTSKPYAVDLAPAGKGSSGNDSFMLYQMLPYKELRGKRLRFGAQVRNEGAGINLVLFTPEGMSNDFDSVTNSGGFHARSGTLTVPANASMLSFGIQVFGRPGTRAVVDDAFVRVDDGAAPSAKEAATPASVRIEIDTSKVERRIEPNVFGMHIEWVQNGQGLVDSSGQLREAVLEKLRDLQIPLFRFPGGIHADYYDWRLGIGPIDSRPQAENVFTGKREPNRFGTAELAALLEATGASALITANYGTGSPEMAGNWARRIADTKIDAPLWEVGNEIYLSGPGETGPNGKRIFHRGEAYARDFATFRAAIQAALPEARVGAICHLDSGAFPLAPEDNRDWSMRMLGALRSPADFFSVHDAYAPVILDGAIDFRAEDQRNRAYASLYASAEQTRENLDAVGAMVDRLSSVNKGKPLAVTEFGPLFGITDNRGLSAIYVDQSRTMASAVYVASLLDVFIGHPRVMAACYTNPIHHWYGSLLTDTDGQLVTTPSYHVYALYRSRFDRNLVATHVTSPQFSAVALGIVKARTGVPDVVAKATLSDDGQRVSVMLVNRSFDQPRAAEIALSGFAVGSVDCRVLSAPSPAAVNGPRLTDTTVAGDISPRKLDCAPSAPLVLRVPPNAVVSMVAQRQTQVRR